MLHTRSRHPVKEQSCSLHPFLISQMLSISKGIILLGHQIPKQKHCKIILVQFPYLQSGNFYSTTPFTIYYFYFPHINLQNLSKTQLLYISISSVCINHSFHPISLGWSQASFHGTQLPARSDFRLLSTPLCSYSPTAFCASHMRIL